jgi:hypothetical protein
VLHRGRDLANAAGHYFNRNRVDRHHASSIISVP